MIFLSVEISIDSSFTSPSICVLFWISKGCVLIMYWESISKLVAPGGLVVSLTSPYVLTSPSCLEDLLGCVAPPWHFA
ncbi:hypothetical protein HanPI659440_Chr15g0585841 [Helianthus annuus]|nr:hypothetical protein HanPI659440_Chr15g0585841 [Helianthus annuus]